MPTYEMPMLLRIMSKNEIASTLKRITSAIFNKGGVIREIANLGEQSIPYKISRHEQVHKSANYFIIHFDAPPKYLVDIKEEYSRDIDIIRTTIFNKGEPDNLPCTFDDEMKPPPYRPEVQKLLQMARKEHAKKNKKRFKHNTGMSYFPFQK